ncbi:MAG: Thiol:disulfide interchange protein DsbD [Phycisphaerae bacterium]|nr:Thiol:disulfide interchange protein DsbD [Phycisphaerae bacterium]
MTLLSTLACLACALQTEPPPTFTARLHAAHQAVSPGGETELAIEVTVGEKWHIYHYILLDTGFATSFKFEAPVGVEIGDVRFPTPQLDRAADMDYLGYHGKLVFLAPLRVAASVAPGTPLDIKVEVSALACKISCVIVNAGASLKLPVQGQMGVAANEKLFADARAAMPAPLSAAPSLKGVAAVSQSPIRAGDTFELGLTIEIEKGLHVQDRVPGVAGLIGARLFVAVPDGFEMQRDRELWSAPKTVDIKEVGRVRQHDGTLYVRVPLKLADSQIPAGPGRLRGLFQYQACDESGQCFLPQMAEWQVAIQVAAADASVAKSDAPVFSAQLDAGGAAAGGGPANGVAPGLALVFFWAFLGGVILNIMPCVLPVISLKVFSFLQIAGESRARLLMFGLTYAGGILASFAVLAIIMVAFRAPWGGIMQSPTYVVVLCAVMLAFALSLFGVFEIQLPGAAMSAMGEATAREGYAGSFMNGVLATALATPCTAPFLGAALGILTQLPALAMGAGIMMVGVGLAAPYVLLTAFPAWLRYLPKPGAWMVTFKELMGFVLLGTLVWLLSILHALLDEAGFMAGLVFLCAVGMACWLIGKLDLNSPRRRTVAFYLYSAAILVIGWFGGQQVFGAWQKIPWQKWEPGLAEKLAGEGYTVYVDFTANWCLTCQTNKRWILETNAVRQRLIEANVYPLKADFTKPSAAIQAELQKHGRNGVPLNIIVPAGKPDEVIVLPEVLTRSIVLEALERAGPSTKEFHPPAGPKLAAAGV